MIILQVVGGMMSLTAETAMIPSMAIKVITRYVVELAMM